LWHLDPGVRFSDYEYFENLGDLGHEKCDYIVVVAVVVDVAVECLWSVVWVISFEMAHSFDTREIGDLVCGIDRSVIGDLVYFFGR
jgi:hypothetical protein